MFIKNGSFRKFTHIISYVPVTITQQPVSTIVGVGTNHTFYIKIVGSIPRTYQWYRNNFPLTGKTTDTLLLTSLSDSDTGVYHCRVGNNSYSYNSDYAELSVLHYPSIITQPESVITPAGSSVYFSVSAGGSPELIYKWYKNNSLTTAYTSAYYIVNANLEEVGDYFVVVSNLVGSVTSTTVSLSVS
jgi:hypothetical protein